MGNVRRKEERDREDQWWGVGRERERGKGEGREGEGNSPAALVRCLPGPG